MPKPPLTHQPYTHAICTTCDVVITPSLYWNLGSSIWLHQNGYAGITHKIKKVRG